MAAVGNTLQGTGEAVLGLVGEPLLPRVERCGCWVMGRPELTTASSKAAAGVRAISGWRYRAREEALWVSTGSCDRVEHDGGLGNGLQWLWPRLHHGRR